MTHTLNAVQLEVLKTVLQGNEKVRIDIIHLLDHTLETLPTEAKWVFLNEAGSLEPYWMYFEPVDAHRARLWVTGTYEKTKSSPAWKVAVKKPGEKPRPVEMKGIEVSVPTEWRNTERGSKSTMERFVRELAETQAKNELKYQVEVAPTGKGAGKSPVPALPLAVEATAPEVKETGDVEVKKEAEIEGSAKEPEELKPAEPAAVTKVPPKVEKKDISEIFINFVEWFITLNDKNDLGAIEEYIPDKSGGNVDIPGNLKTFLQFLNENKTSVLKNPTKFQALQSKLNNSNSVNNFLKNIKEFVVNLPNQLKDDKLKTMLESEKKKIETYISKALNLTKTLTPAADSDVTKFNDIINTLIKWFKNDKNTLNTSIADALNKTKIPDEIFNLVRYINKNNLLKNTSNKVYNNLKDSISATELKKLRAGAGAGIYDMKRIYEQLYKYFNGLDKKWFNDKYQQSITTLKTETEIILNTLKS